MILGEYEYSIDQKGRIAIPAKFREDFKEGLVLSRGYDRCLVGYALSEWRNVAEKLTALPDTHSDSRRLNRATFSSAFSLELDHQGRIILPSPLRAYAQIKDSVIIAGLYSRFEVWSKENWASEKETMNEQAWHIAESTEFK